MEVVRQNYKEALPKISASLKKADFLVVDAEFTGLLNGREVSIFDTPKDYYIRYMKGCSDFLLIQFGLCAFYWNEEKKIYMNDAYNFYLFPRRPGPDKMFLCQSSSLDFLCGNGFDFNKLIRNGISYMTEPLETKLRENLTEKQKTYSKEKDIVSIPEEHKTFIEDTCKNVKQFIDENKEDEMVIDRCNAFVRLLVYQELRLHFKSEVIVSTEVLENKNRIIKVTRIKSSADTKNHDEKRKEKEWEDLEDAVGFSKVARMISQSGKLVVGHNMLLDVLHTLNHFFQPLPDDYECFKDFAHCMFPWILDTKYLSSRPPFKDSVNSSVLPHLLATLSEPPFSVPRVGSLEGQGYSVTNEKLHEAGYDAYITGLCFLAMHTHLSHMRGEENVRVDPRSAVLKPFLNKLFLARTAHQDSPYINLTGPDPTPSRDHVFHLTFPKEWTRGDITQLFSPFSTVVVQFVDDTHAWVALHRRDQARQVLRAIRNNSKVTLRPYEEQKFLSQPAQRSIETAEQLRRATVITNKPQTETRSQTLLSGTETQRATGAPHLPEKVARVRSSSATSSSPPQNPRKRTSSGLVQEEDVEPPQKKNAHVRTKSDGDLKKTKAVYNGRRKMSSTPERDPESIEKKVIETFSAKEKTTCVSAFKESDSWD